MFSPKNDASSGFVTLSETNIDEGGKASPSKGASVPKTGESSSLLSRSDLEAQSVATGSKIVVPWWKNRIYIGAAAVIGVAVLTISLIVVYEQDSGRNARHTTILISFGDY